MSPIEFFGEPIFVYTRQQAFADGMLIDVTEWAAETGFTIPVAFTAALYAECENGDVRGRAHDVLWLAFLAVRAAIQNSAADEVPLAFRVTIGSNEYDLWFAFTASEGFTIGFLSEF